MKIKSNKFIESKYPYFIADIAANHDGDLNRAKELIWQAKESGADCAKFQHFKADKIINSFEFNKIGKLRSHQSSWNKSVFEIYDQYHFKRDWTFQIYEECMKAGIDFSTTPYDAEALNLVKKIVSFIKIGSGDITWTEHIENCAKIGLPILLATGASSLKDVDRAVKIIKKFKNQLCIMQCNTNYTIDEDKVNYINLKVLKIFQKRYNKVILGLSDHTLTDTSVLGSLCFGAKIIEKHFTDDNLRAGPDHKFAINPKNWELMVSRSRELIDEFGDGIKKIEFNEKNSVIIQRRSCCAKRNIKKNQIIHKDDIDFLRPRPIGSINPYEYKKIAGKKALKIIKKGEAFKWKNIS